jgi:hypothetical protein
MFVYLAAVNLTCMIVILRLSCCILLLLLIKLYVENVHIAALVPLALIMSGLIVGVPLLLLINDSLEKLTPS